MGQTVSDAPVRSAKRVGEGCSTTLAGNERPARSLRYCLQSLAGFSSCLGQVVKCIPGRQIYPALNACALAIAPGGCIGYLTNAFCACKKGTHTRIQVIISLRYPLNDRARVSIAVYQSGMAS